MMLFLDTETYIKEGDEYKPILDCRYHKLTCIGYKTRNGNNQYIFFTDRMQVQQYLYNLAQSLKREKRKLYIYAHSARYDYYTIFREKILENNNIRTQPLYAELWGNTYFLDTMAFYNYSLEQLGEELGIPKLKMPDKITEIKQLVPYIEQDVRITMEGIYKLKTDLRKIGIKAKRLMTAGQISINNYMNYAIRNNFSSITRFDREKKQWEIIPTKHDEYARKAYKIGRCEAFQTGHHENATMIDKNGLFPYAMTIMEIPKLEDEMFCERPLEIMSKSNLLEKHTGIVNATVNTGNYYGIGILPIKEGKYLTFPRLGTITGTWTIPEIRYALSKGYELERIHSALFYPISRQQPFENYMEELYRKRLENPEIGSTIKLLMNNVHGKLGQNLEYKETRIGHREDIEEMRKQGFDKITEIGEDSDIMIFERRVKRYNAHYSNVVLSALTVSTARMLMCEEYAKIPEDDLLYTDVDSIMFLGNHLSKFDIGKGLGKFKVIKQGEQADIKTEKVYRIGETIKMSGVPKKGMKAEDIHHTEVTVNNIIDFKEALLRGDINLVGTFEQQVKTIQEKQTIEKKIKMEFIEE